MATTTKKSTVKKPSSKTTATKKTTTAQSSRIKNTSVTKKPSHSSKKRSSSARTKTPEYKSFQIAKDTQKFNDFRITKQTVYWVILICFIIFVQLWILKLQIEVTTLIEAQQADLLNF